MDAQLLTDSMTDEHIEQFECMSTKGREIGASKGFDSFNGDGDKTWIDQILCQHQDLSDCTLLRYIFPKVYQCVESQCQKLSPGRIFHHFFVPKIRLHGLHEFTEAEFTHERTARQLEPRRQQVFRLLVLFRIRLQPQRIICAVLLHPGHQFWARHSRIAPVTAHLQAHLGNAH